MKRREPLRLEVTTFARESCKLFFVVFGVILAAEGFATEYLTDTDHLGADWTLANGDSVAGNHTNIGTFTIPGGATVGVKAYNGTSYGGVTIQATTMDIAGTLNATAKGYVQGTGTAPGVSCTGGSGGAGHGGAGGTGSQCGGGAAYDDQLSPAIMGSGGGYSSAQSTGGTGGGKIKLVCSNGTVILNGALSANGSAGGTLASGYAGGGGSGGSVWIIANTIAGSGTITANGGNGCTSTYFGGGVVVVLL